ncbi:hypothetical protein BKA82DRAFT_3994154, partial [Pisolithus tinctorius]
LPSLWKVSPVSYLPVSCSRPCVSLCFDALAAGIVNWVSVEQMHKHIRYLTNEERMMGIASGHSFDHDFRVAAEWLKTQFQYAYIGIKGISLYVAFFS